MSGLEKNSLIFLPKVQLFFCIYFSVSREVSTITEPSSIQLCTFGEYPTTPGGWKGSALILLFRPPHQSSITELPNAHENVFCWKEP